MSVLRKILSPKQTREDSTSEQHSQPSRTFSASSMSVTQYNGAKASAPSRPRSEELENVDYGRPSDFLKGSHVAEAAQTQTPTTSAERNGNVEGRVESEAYSDVPIPRPAQQRLTAGALKRQEVQNAIKSQVQSLKKGHSRSRSNGQVMDTSEYSTPWNQVVQEREQQALQHTPIPSQEPEAHVIRQPLPQDNPPRAEPTAALHHHYETPTNSNSRPPKPPRSYPLSESLEAPSHFSPPHHFISPPATIERGSVDRRNTSAGMFLTGLQPGDYDEPWEKKLKELNFRLPQKPRHQDSPVVVPRDKLSPTAMEQRGRSERNMRRTPTPDDSIVKRSVGSETGSLAGSLPSLGGQFDQRHVVSTDTPTSFPRTPHSRPLPAPPIPTPRRPSPSPGTIQSLAPLEEQSWFHPKLSRAEAEKFLENQPDFSFIVRNSESCRTDYSLSIRDKSPNGSGYIHLRIELSDKGYVLGQFSSAFPTVPECIAHYTRHRLTIRGAEHKRLNLGM